MIANSIARRSTGPTFTVEQVWSLLTLLEVNWQLGWDWVSTHTPFGVSLAYPMNEWACVRSYIWLTNVINFEKTDCPSHTSLNSSLSIFLGFCLWCPPMPLCPPASEGNTVPPIRAFQSLSPPYLASWLSYPWQNAGWGCTESFSPPLLLPCLPSPTNCGTDNLCIFTVETTLFGGCSKPGLTFVFYDDWRNTLSGWSLSVLVPGHTHGICPASWDSAATVRDTACVVVWIRMPP